MKRDDFRPIKIRTEAHVRLKRLMERITQVGWAAIGSERTTPATIADVADEALQMLDDKVTAAEKKRR